MVRGLAYPRSELADYCPECTRSNIIVVEIVLTPMPSLNQVADDDVVEVLDGLPLDALAQVFLLLLLQRQLDEQLLELLVAEVDAELLETETES